MFALLDDPDPEIRKYAWDWIEPPGRAVGAGGHALQRQILKRFIDVDGAALKQRIEILLAADLAKVAPELGALKVKARGVPELAALLVASSGFASAFSPNERRDLEIFAKLVRASDSPPSRVSASDAEILRYVAALPASPSRAGISSPVEAATSLAGVRLAPAHLDAVEHAVKDRSLSADVRWRLAVALIRNERPAPALGFVDDILSDPNVPDDQRKSAMDVLTELVLVDAAAGEQAVAARAPRLRRLLDTAEHMPAVTALLGRVASDDAAKENSLQLLKRAEAGAGLSGSACSYASIMPRSPQVPIGLALFGRQDSTSGPKELAACIIFLDPNTATSRELRMLLVGPASPSFEERRVRLASLDGLWSQTDTLQALGAPEATTGARRRLAARAATFVDAAPIFEFSAAGAVARWASRAEPFGPTNDFFWPYWSRWLLTRVPAAATLGLAWLGGVVALVSMSRSNALRAFLLFHPLGRKLAVFGQVSALVFAVGGLRRRFFKPFAGIMLGPLAQQHARDQGERSYFSGSGIAPLQRGGISAQIRNLDSGTVAGDAHAMGSVAALRAWKGRVVLIGQSGRGKTSFLRHHILAGGAFREPAIFATAASLGREPQKALVSRFGGAIPDNGFLDSLVSSGRLDIYIDGLNEVDAETRAAITDYVTARPGANIFVTTQPLDRYPGDASLFLLLPLAKPQILDFLVTREATLPDRAPMTGAAYRAQAEAFVIEKLAEAEAQSSPGDEGGAERTRTLVERLSNPMDLQTIAELLALGKRPDVWALQQQRHAIVEQRYRDRSNGEAFPLDVFSRCVYEARRDGVAEIDHERFPRVAEVLLEEKQIQRFIAAEASFDTGAFVFRHDKIRDFYTYRAFIDDPALRIEHASGDKFSGVYDLLSLELPANEAAELREFLSERALDRGDHRLSDRYLEGLRARRLLQRKDPAWLSEFDRPDVAPENLLIARGEEARQQVLDELARSVARLDAGRAGTRVLTAARSDALLEASASLLEEVGHRRVGVGAGQRLLMEDSDGARFGLVALAHHGRPPDRLVQSTLAILAVLTGPEDRTLLVVNVEADLPPHDRSDDGPLSRIVASVGSNVAVATAFDLLVRTRSAPAAPLALVHLWDRRER